MTQSAEIKSPQGLEKKTLEQKEAEGPASLSNYTRVFTYGSKTDIALVLLCAVGAIGAGIAMPLMFLILGRIVGDLASYFTPTSKVTKHQFLAGINKNTLIMLNLAIVRLVLAYISMVSIRISGVRISARLRLAYIKALFNQPVTTIDELSPGAVASRLTTNSTIIESGISQQFFLAIQALSFTLGLFVVAVIRNWLLTIVALVAIPIVVVAYGFAVPFLNKYWYQAEAEKDLASALSYEIFQSIRIVVAFGAEKKLGQDHYEIMERARKIDRKQAPIMGAMFAPMFMAIYGIFALTFWFGVRQYSKGKIHSVSTVIVVLFSVLWAVMSIYHLYNPILEISRAASACKNIFAIIDAPVLDESKLIPNQPALASEDITFHDVSFSYPTRPDTIVLNKLNLTFESGKNTAIVGPSGSGKSTIVGLIEKWYFPASQESQIPGDTDLSTQMNVSSEKKEVYVESKAVTSGIYVGDVNLNDIQSRWWRTNIGLVQQEPFLFNDTIFNNVANGLAGTIDENLPLTEKQVLVESSCREAFAQDFIEKLPEGYNTVVGEGGLKLSGGQRQRIAIARALIKNPAILILDEATSAIDVRTEKLLQEVLDRVSRSRTTITIAHRLSTVKKADKIVVLRNGKMVEQGTHDDLILVDGGFYKGLVNAQIVEIGEEEEEDPDIISEARDFPSPVDYSRSATNAKTLPPDQDNVQSFSGGLIKILTKLTREQRSKALLYVLLLLACMAGSATYPIQAWLFAKVVSVFTKPPSVALKKGNFLALMFVAQAFATGLAFLILGWVAAIIAADVTAFYRQNYLEHMLRKRINFFDNDKNTPGTLTSRLSVDSAQIRTLIGGEMALQLVAIFGIIGSISIAMVYGWKLALIGLAAIMPLSMAAGYYRVHLERGFEELNAKVFAETAQWGTSAISAYRTVTALTMESAIVDKFDVLLHDHVTKAVKKTRFSTIIFALSESIDMFCQPLFFWYGGKLLADFKYDLISFLVIYMAIVQSSSSLGMWFSFSPNIAEATAAACRIFGIRSISSTANLPNLSPGGGPASIEFRNVHFTYSDRDTAVLQGVNIKIHPGQFAAFVGPSGSGKSTLISLLERFYDPSAGAILFDGIPIDSISSSSYRAALSIVTQESTLYEGTIRSNILLSVPDSSTSIPDTRLHAAARAAQIHDFITSLPEGYDTYIGSRGVALSGGQRQRLALTRALLREPRLLLLDEATASLDGENEQAVQTAIEASARGKSTIIAVAHRLSTVKNADVIFVLGSNGRVVESGNHEVLVAKRGIYYEMCQAQALDR